MDGDPISSSIVAAAPWVAQAFLMAAGTFGGLCAAIIYFVKADRAAPLWRRGLASIYAAVPLLLWLAGSLLPTGVRTHQASSWYLWLQLLPAGALLYSLVAYPGRRALHLWLVPVSVVSWLWVTGIGHVAIFGK